ncbi:HNH endonuclease [Agrococcus terreus]|uniref:HNH domain-containing protein n=1 Tax=Agrococcus terreus TaxID=574649 RepID=A0ABQ2KQA4_9MICO|nr:HNH endonuclease signature motif containing protein [Agrococcus terreus]GGN89270.1 hypothetical protein GCM10010968_25760 [Agrococcus terreus]
MDAMEMVLATLGTVWRAVSATPQLFVPALVIMILLIVVNAPIPGRGPRSAKRDPWRGFKYAPRAAVLHRAGGRCEGSAFLAWGRCDEPATDVDYVYPWSKGGPTVTSNGQALCRGHNRNKSAWTPPWWYVVTLERRRRSYFPAGIPVEVRAVMTDEERAARERRRPATR